jgi:hypothetical protein
VNWQRKVFLALWFLVLFSLVAAARLYARMERQVRGQAPSFFELYFRNPGFARIISTCRDYRHLFPEGKLVRNFVLLVLIQVALVFTGLAVRLSDW